MAWIFVPAVEQRRYVSVEVADMLSTFIVNDQPDPARFLRVAGLAAFSVTRKATSTRESARGTPPLFPCEQGDISGASSRPHAWNRVQNAKAR